MKKIITSLFLMASATVAFSQTFKLTDHGTDVTGDTIVVYAGTPSTNQTDIGLQNTTSNSVNYNVSRIIFAPVPTGNDVYFCAGSQCYPPDVNTVFTGITETIGANESFPSPSNPLAFGILADYDINGSNSDFYVMYSVKNLASAGDSSTVVIYYKSSGVGINDLESSANMTNAYPNPSNTFTSIKYELNDVSANSKILLYDMLGKVVKEVSIKEKQGIVKLDLTEMNSGVYFYSFIVDEKTISTKKLVVSTK